MFLVYAVLPYSVSMSWNPHLDYLYPRFCSAIQVWCAKLFKKICEPSQNVMRRHGDVKQAPH